MLAIILGGLPLTVYAIKIIELSGPHSVINGTENVTLTCEYSYDEKADSGYVIKWLVLCDQLFNNDPAHISQWIQKEQSEPKCTDGYRLCPLITVNNAFDETPASSITLIKATTSLNGKYTCSLASLNGFSSSSHNLTIYGNYFCINANLITVNQCLFLASPTTEPAKEFSFQALRENNQIDCTAVGLFPMPTIELYQTPPKTESKTGKKERINLSDSAKVEYTQSESGQYTVKISYYVNDTSLDEKLATHFECVISIPGTNYTESDSFALRKGEK
ncbi:uncharacterized protein B4U79_02322 [Dinothrombium tinctorium]|uniref:Ig-like domain-containing protein n=1 Tax=Dinothrombium tinctorium TaxID=1965070 RepID=A0A3S3P7C6_9ACAR|nr:uncharacterized protein B4U79_02322 [Dinothrombium tinctorium]